MFHKVFVANAKALRKKMTNAETALWKKLRSKSLGVKFYRQFVFEDKFILDFYCRDCRLVVEVDGGQHCDNEDDKIRDEYLRGRGCKILRFWNNDVLSNVDGCLEVIKRELNLVV